MGKVTEAVKTCEAAIQTLSKDHEWILKEMGELMAAADRHEEAKTYLDRAAKISPKTAAYGMSTIGGRLYKAQDYATAIQYLKMAVQHSTDHLSAWQMLGLSYSNLKMHAKARAAFDKVDALKK